MARSLTDSETEDEKRQSERAFGWTLRARFFRDRGRCISFWLAPGLGLGLGPDVNFECVRFAKASKSVARGCSGGLWGNLRPVSVKIVENVFEFFESCATGHALMGDFRAAYSTAFDM